MWQAHTATTAAARPAAAAGPADAAGPAGPALLSRLQRTQHRHLLLLQRLHQVLVLRIGLGALADECEQQFAAVLPC